MSDPIPSPEFALMQERRIRELQQYCYRVYNTLKFIGQDTTNPKYRERAYATLETEPSHTRQELPIPSAWARHVISYCGANEPPERDVEVSYGDDRPEGDDWFPLYRLDFAVREGT